MNRPIVILLDDWLVNQNGDTKTQKLMAFVLIVENFIEAVNDARIEFFAR